MKVAEKKVMPSPFYPKVQCVEHGAEKYKNQAQTPEECPLTGLWGTGGGRGKATLIPPVNAVWFSCTD